MRNYKHTEEYVEKVISYGNLTRNDVVVAFRERGRPVPSYREALKELRSCDVDTMRWILGIGKYSQ